jgi:hypothetical protein
LKAKCDVSLSNLAFNFNFCRYIKEIINAAKNISTPIITATLMCDNDVKAARLIKVGPGLGFWV